MENQEQEKKGSALQGLIGLVSIAIVIYSLYVLTII